MFNKMKTLVHTCAFLSYLDVFPISHLVQDHTGISSIKLCLETNPGVVQLFRLIGIHVYSRSCIFLSGDISIYLVFAIKSTELNCMRKDH